MQKRTCPSCWKMFSGGGIYCPPCQIKIDMEEKLKKEKERMEREYKKREEKLKEELEEERENFRLKIHDENRRNFKQQEYLEKNSWKIEASSKMQRAWELIHLGMTEEALSLADNALYSNPSLLDAHFIKCYLLYKAGKVQEVRNLIQELIGLSKLADYDYKPEYFMTIVAFAIEIDLGFGVSIYNQLANDFFRLLEDQRYFMRHEEKFQIGKVSLRDHGTDLSTSPRFQWSVSTIIDPLPNQIESSIQHVRATRFFQPETIDALIKLAKLTRKWVPRKKRKPISISDLNNYSDKIFNRLYKDEFYSALKTTRYILKEGLFLRVFASLLVSFQISFHFLHKFSFNSFLLNALYILIIMYTFIAIYEFRHWYNLGVARLADNSIKSKNSNRDKISAIFGWSILASVMYTLYVFFMVNKQ